ncbi:hypothetical protein DEO23_10040 [Brachybacterium endophyticum]|uniref:RNA-binding protein n=2 Tax=Brachybacterium endophyticum TaxID=2182385 RepID=A0A2U2RJW5_9MICO|nr:hypothetical protein DEO23_10040 [Brachybacterium endophyticum]
MMAGLVHPESIVMWREWARSAHRGQDRRAALVNAARALRRPHGTEQDWSEPAWILHSRAGEGDSRVLIALEDGSERPRAALLSFLPYLRVGVDVIVPRGVAAPELDGPNWRRRAFESARDAVPTDAGAVITAGQHGPPGIAVHQVARRRGLRSIVVQADTLTPYAAPLPEDALLLAWSEEDADFWRSGREDLELLPVGSQRLWQLGHTADETDRGDDDASDAGADADADADADTDRASQDGRDGESRTAPVVLGQLSRLELPRSVAARAASDMIVGGGARYLPGAAETGRLARLQHRLWERRGAELLDADTDPLTLRAPLVSILATEVLETAARGGEAWVHAPGAPAWVHEYWHRYGMRRHGAPTPAPTMPQEEPAAAIARVIDEVMGS